MDEQYLRRIYGEECRPGVHFEYLRNTHPSRKIRVWVKTKMKYNNQWVYGEVQPYPCVLRPTRHTDSSPGPDDMSLIYCPITEAGQRIEFLIESEWA